MYKTAAAIWGVRNVDNFDSVIKLLIESQASEISRLSNELDNVEARILERLAGTLTPDILMSVHPAHMILHVKPAEDYTTVNKDTSFFFKTKNNHQFYFSPAGNFNLINGDVKSIICAGKMYLIDSLKSKEIFASSRKRSGEFTNNLWIGLHLHPAITSVKNISFYFDLLNMEKKNELLHLLSYSQWEHEGSRLSTRPGMNVLENSEKKRSFTPLAEYDPANLSDGSIINNYNHHFITVTSEIINKKEHLKPAPDELSDIFPQVEAAEKQTPLLWFKVTFPPGFDSYILDDFFVSINAFPVINRKFYSKYFKTSPLVSVIPFEMAPNEYFFSVDNVTDSNNRKYLNLPLGDNDNAEFGTYILRRGGAERFDSRNAKELMSNLIDRLREENISFSLFGKEFINEAVKNIDRNLSSIESTLKAVRINEDIPSYILIDSNNVGDIVYVDYWVTNSESANGIKSGIPLRVFDGNDLNNDSIVTLTQSYGGQRRRDQSPDMYKYALTCRDRIYTDADIVNFCFSRFGDIITSAAVKKGVSVSPRPKEGLIRTIDVHITLNEQIRRTSADFQEIEDHLLSLLKSKSPDMYNFRVFISNQTGTKQ